MEKEVQLFVVGIVGAVAILTVFTRQTDLSQVCIAGLIGFLGAKATGIPDAMTNNAGYELTIKKDNKKKIKEVDLEEELE